MRSLALLLVILAACGDNNAAKNKPDAASGHDDAKVFEDAKVFMDAPAFTGDGIMQAKAAADGTGLTLPIRGVTVTYLKPQLGSTTTDPAGFTIQHDQAGPALFVSVDPATLTPPPVVGDVVDFTITAVSGAVAMQKRATAIDLASYQRTAQGANVDALAVDVSTATDLVSALDTYDSRVLNVTGTLADDVGTSGSGFSKFTLATAGIPSNASLQLRVPTTLVASAVMTQGCGVVAHDVTMGKFNTTAEIGAFNAADLTLTCFPIARAAAATSVTTATITFQRDIDMTTAMAANAFQVNDGATTSPLTVTSVVGKVVIVTTPTQTSGTTYTVTVAQTVQDAQGNTASAAQMITFAGFSAPASVRINEVNANITGGCDLIELRVIADGSMAGFKITERTGSAANNELSFTFPAGFNVHKNDYIVVHENSGSATCNVNGATTETMMKNQQPAAMFAGNYDTAFDFWVADAGLVATNNVITLYDATATVTDAVFLSDVTDTAAATTLSAAAIVGTANQWSPAQTSYLAAEFDAAAVTDLNATGPAASGTSIQRINDADTNALADWTTGAGVASTWGANNAGQADIP
ncbi:MAG TPA: Ig-like domain-containing protein [Kofleriaceae bacterium]|nr:Ig-like domain-containing protein [Kofleriaceae bacterium]